MPTPRYKIRPDTGDLQEYLFEYNGILALKNFVARVDGERLILHSAADMNFSILDALVSEVEIDGRVYDNAEAAQEALMRLTFNTNRPVIMTQQERELLQGALQKGTYVGTAADLKALIDGKVDKVPGKILSTNDFTNELRAKLEGLRNVDISGLLPKGGYTGTAQNLKELIDNIMRILQSPDTELDELREIVAYIKQNKRTLDTLGISNIAGLQDALNGKAATNHNHDDRYSRLSHTHSEYALRTHRHNWDDIDRKPSLDFIPTSWNKRNNKEVIRTQVDEWLRINDLNSHANGVYFYTSILRTDNQVQIGEGGAEAVLSNLGLTLKKKLRINAWSGGDGADIKCKGKMQIGSVSGIIEFRKILDNLVDWNGNSTIILDITDGKITSKILDTNRIIFGSENNIISAWSGGFDLATRQNLLNLGALNVIKFRKIDDTGWKNDLIEMNVNDGTLRVNGIKSNANVSGEYLFTTNGSTMHLPSFIGTCGQISGVWNITTSWYGRQINIVGVSTVNLSSMSQNQSIAFRKCFAGGAVTFNTTGKQVVYTGDNTFNGGDGSTAVVSTAGGNKMYIDIRNV